MKRVICSTPGFHPEHALKDIHSALKFIHDVMSQYVGDLDDLLLNPQYYIDTEDEIRWVENELERFGSLHTSR